MERTLFIGVGGSGGETVRYIMRELDRRLRSAGWHEGLPTAWQFVHIDVRQNPDDIESSIPAALASRLVHLGLGAFPLKYSHYANKLQANAAIAASLPGWLPAPDSSQSPPYTGAGQRRAVGRAVAAAELKAIADLIGTVSTQMSHSDANEELTRLAAHLNAGVNANAGQGLAFVIGSLGGGAGSGAFLDVIQLLRAQSSALAWLASPYAVLYAPDVFDKLPDGSTRGVAANSLAAMSELMNAYVHTGPLELGDAAVLEAAGGTGTLVDRVGPEAVLMVGGSSGADGVTFGAPGEIYQAVGKAMAALVGSEEVANQFDTYVRSNFGVASPPLNLPLSLGGQPNPISSLGYASVSLGKELFAEYAAERLASAVLRRLREGYLEDKDGAGFVRIETLIENRAQSAKEDFFRQAGLWEVGKEHNQVLDALRDSDAKRRELDELRDKVLAKAVGRAEMSVEDWLQRINTAFNAAAEKVEADETAQRNQNATEWVVSIQDQLLTTTVESVARHGFDVTMRLLDLLVSQIEDAERTLDKEREDQGRREKGALDNLAQHFAHLKARARAKLRGDGTAASFKAVLQTRRDAFSDRTEADLRKLAQDLLQDVRVRLIPPIKAVVDAMSTSLSDDLSVAEVKTEVAQWSQHAVSSHLLPTPNEVLLTKPGEFPGVLDEILVAMFETPIKDALGEALEEIVRGGWPSDEQVEGGPQSLVAPTGQWQPDISAIREPGRAVRAASFASLLTADRVHDMAAHWVRSRRGPLSGYVEETLGEWLTASDSQLRKRGDLFKNALTSALTRAKPLASMDDNVSQRVHGRRVGKPNLLISPIPMASDNPSRAATEKVLGSVLPDKAAVQKVFGNSSEDTVEILGFPQGTVHPVVLGSFTDSVQSEWVTRRGARATLSDFWEYRRARPLLSHVGLPPEIIRSMIQGWIIAQLLGYWDEVSGRLWTPAGHRSFPAPISVRHADNYTLPALLESYSLALLSYAAGSTGELEAYNELIRLGAETSGLGALVPSVVAGDPLRQWVTTGKPVKDAPTPDEDFAGTPDSTPAGRAEVLMRSLKEAGGAYELLKSAQTFDPGLEVRDAYLGAVHAIEEAVVAFRDAAVKRKIIR